MKTLLFTTFLLLAQNAAALPSEKINIGCWKPGNDQFRISITSEVSPTKHPVTTDFETVAAKTPFPGFETVSTPVKISYAGPRVHHWEFADLEVTTHRSRCANAQEKYSLSLAGGDSIEFSTSCGYTRAGYLNGFWIVNGKTTPIICADIQIWVPPSPPENCKRC